MIAILGDGVRLTLKPTVIKNLVGYKTSKK